MCLHEERKGHPHLQAVALILCPTFFWRVYTDVLDIATANRESPRERPDADACQLHRGATCVSSLC